MYSLYQFFIYVSSATVIFLTAFVFYKNKANSLSYRFAFLNISFLLWMISYAKMYSVQNEQIAYILSHVGFVGTTLVPLFLFLFLLDFIERKINKFIKGIYILISLFFVIFTIFSNLIISELTHTDWSVFPSAGAFHFLFLIYTTVIFLHAIFYAYKYIQTDEITSIKKQKTIYLMLIYGVYFAFFIFDNLFFYNLFDFEPTFYLSILFCVIPITTIISSYNLSNIKVAAIKFLLFIFMLALVLILTNYILISSTNIYVSNFITFMLTISFFMFYRKVINKAENILFSQNKHYQNILIHAASGMAKEHNIDRLLKLIAIIVVKTVKVSFAAIFLENQTTGNYEIKILRAFSNKNNELLFSYDKNHPFINFIKQKNEPFLFDEMPQFIAHSVVLPFRPALIIPSFFEDIKGFMIIGEKNNKDIFTKEDMSVFKMLARQTSLAIENCLFFEQYKQAQEKISAAEKLASIGGLAEGVAHQIRNRLNQFSLISGELKFEIEDFQNNNKETVNTDKNLKSTFNYITELSTSLKNNVDKTNEIIKGILDFAKMESKSTMFETFKFKEIVDLSYDMLKIKHHLPDNFLFIKNFKDDDTVFGVKSQIMEVIYNLIDNAFEAIEEKTNISLNKKPIRHTGRIEVSLIKKNDFSIIKISDNGSGIKEQNFGKIFVPFFTTKSSRKSGTGIGMYIVKRMIVENHNGKIWFESKHMTGTDIFIELPNH